MILRSSVAHQKLFTASYAIPYRIHAKRRAVSPASSTADDARRALAALQDDKKLPAFVGPDYVPEVLPAGWRPAARQTPLTLLSTYRALSKERLSILMVLTAMAGYAICPGVTEAATNAASIGPMLPAPSLFGPLAASSLPHSPLTTLLSLTAGTYLLSASTNAINQIREAPLDAQMPRTLGRPLPRRLISSLHASSFAATTGLLGIGTLYYLTSPLVAFLGLTNHVLYAFVYTPAKRSTILNTPIGAVVGAVPPLMGWAAASGTLLEPSDAPGWALAGILFAWQYPHFNALAYTLRYQYAQAGYRMLASLNPLANARSALRGSIGIAAICVAMPLYICPDVLVGNTFLYGSLLLNSALIWSSTRFWLACRRTPAEQEAWGESAEEKEKEKTAKQLFYASLAHLPTLLILMMLCKTGTVDDLQTALAKVTGREPPVRAPVKPTRDGVFGTSVFKEVCDWIEYHFRRLMHTQSLPNELETDEYSGTEIVKVGSRNERGGLAPAPDALDATLTGSRDADSIGDWRQRASRDRLV